MKKDGLAVSESDIPLVGRFLSTVPSVGCILVTFLGEVVTGVGDSMFL